MDCKVLEAPDYAGRPGIQESPGDVPYRLGPAMQDLVEQNDVIGAYRTCIHWTVQVPYGWGGEQAYAENTLQYQIVAFHVRRNTEEFERLAG